MPLSEVEKGNIVPRKRGRPLAFKAEHNEQAFRLALLGATDEEMAEFWDISVQTLNVWKKSAPGFLAALMRGKLEADAKVAEKLYQRALGYSHKAVKIFMPAGAAEPVYAPYTEHYPPDTTAATQWLALRQKGRWAQKHAELTVNINVDLRNKPDADLRAEIASMMARIGGGVTDVVDEKAEAEGEGGPD